MDLLGMSSSAKEERLASIERLHLVIAVAKRAFHIRWIEARRESAAFVAPGGTTCAVCAQWWKEPMPAALPAQLKSQIAVEVPSAGIGAYQQQWRHHGISNNRAGTPQHLKKQTKNFRPEPAHQTSNNLLREGTNCTILVSVQQVDEARRLEASRACFGHRNSSCARLTGTAASAAPPSMNVGPMLKIASKGHRLCQSQALGNRLTRLGP